MCVNWQGLLEQADGYRVSLLAGRKNFLLGLQKRKKRE